MRLKQFDDNEAVKNAVLASACIAGLPMCIPGYGYAMDGAFSDFQIIKVQHFHLDIHTLISMAIACMDCRHSTFAAMLCMLVALTCV